MFKKLNISEKQTGFVWGDHEFLIESVISDSHLYLASIETIYLDGKKLISSGGFKSKHSTTGEFTDSSGDLHEIELKCSKSLDGWLSFTVLIDRKIIYKGATPIKGILNTIAVYTPIIFLLLLMLGKLFGFYLITFNL